jgi:hypothetical protein
METIIDNIRSGERFYQHLAALNAQLTETGDLILPLMRPSVQERIVKLKLGHQVD